MLSPYLNIPHSVKSHRNVVFKRSSVASYLGIVRDGLMLLGAFWLIYGGISSAVAMLS